MVPPMKPVAIFRHKAVEGPAYFATYLQSRQIPYVVIRIDAGDPVHQQQRRSGEADLTLVLILRPEGFAEKS